MQLKDGAAAFVNSFRRTSPAGGRSGICIIKSKVLSRSAHLALLCVVAFLLGLEGGAPALRAASAAVPTFYRDVLPILEQHCQSCHRPGEIAPMSLVTYDQTRPWARAIQKAVRLRKMPPWFADPHHGRFSNDPSLTPKQIEMLSSWADANSPAGDPHDALPSRHWAEGWNIPEPDVVVQMSKPVTNPARGDIEYTYEIVPTGFTEEKWAQMSEIRPSSRQNVHHAVVYIRPPDSRWLRRVAVGMPFRASTLADEQDRPRRARDRQ